MALQGTTSKKDVSAFVNGPGPEALRGVYKTLSSKSLMFLL